LTTSFFNSNPAWSQPIPILIEIIYLIEELATKSRIRIASSKIYFKVNRCLI
jgi:hypothetical protein